MPRHVRQVIAVPADEDEAASLFGEHLHEHGLRLTRQRREILDEICRRTDHFAAEELHEALRDSGANASLATVYRTLGHLRECGVIREVMRLHGSVHFERDFGTAHHDHLVCVECGRLIEFRDETIEALQQRVCKQFGFHALNHRMSIRGLCAECQQAREQGDEHAD